MIRISLTDLMDIVSKSGTTKATKVKYVKERPDYEPAHDFYKPLREFIIERHKHNKQNKNIDIWKITGNLSDKRKRDLYPVLIEGYKKWCGRKKFQWHDPQKGTYSSNGIEVMINPELGLEFGSEQHLIKLYFKSDALSKFKINIITSLMELQLRLISDNNVKMSVLDIRNAKLFTYNGAQNIKPIIDAELAYIASFWSST